MVGSMMAKGSRLRHGSKQLLPKSIVRLTIICRDTLCYLGSVSAWANETYRRIGEWYAGWRDAICLPAPGFAHDLSFVVLTICNSLVAHRSAKS